MFHRRGGLFQNEAALCGHISHTLDCWSLDRDNDTLTFDGAVEVRGVLTLDCTCNLTQHRSTLPHAHVRRTRARPPPPGIHRGGDADFSRKITSGSERASAPRNAAKHQSVSRSLRRCSRESAPSCPPPPHAASPPQPWRPPPLCTRPGVDGVASRAAAS